MITEGTQIEGPVYTATSKSYGPKAITIDQYRARNSKSQPKTTEKEDLKSEQTKKKRRGGKRTE